MRTACIAFAAIVGLGLHTGAATAAVIEDAATAVVIVNGRPFDLSDGFVTNPLTHTSSLNADLSLPTGTISLDITLGTSELLTFGAVTTNNIAGPITYSFFFGTPATARNYRAATMTGGVTLTPGVGGSSTLANSATYPTFLSGYGTAAAVPTNLGVDRGTGPVTASGGVGAPATAQAFGLASNTFAPTFYDGLQALLTYTQNDIASTAAWSGSVTLSVPEPTALTAGLLLLIGRRRRK